MASITSAVRDKPIVSFFILAYALTWITIPLTLISPAFGVPGLLAPAISAVLVTGWTEGREGVRRLLGRLLLWRTDILWYIVAIGLPILVSLAINYLGVLLGAPNQVQVSPISPLAAVVFVLVVGEEIGWRGYALPAMLLNQSALRASLILGILWGFWHLPTFFMPGLPQAGIPFLAFLVYAISLSVLFTWIYQHTQGSLLLATLFHGAIDTFGFINPALDRDLRWWLTAGVYAAVALVVLIAYGKNLKRE